jgi:hypothetical protein
VLPLKLPQQRLAAKMFALQLPQQHQQASAPLQQQLQVRQAAR